MNGSAAWQQFEAGFLSSGERLFYRAWQPAQDRPTS